jgi:hypothetical protein
MWFLIVTIIGCLLLLGIETTPGLFSSGLLCPCFSILLLVGAVGGWLAVWLQGVRPRQGLERKRWMSTAGCVVLTTALLAFTHVPQRIALWSVRDDFESLLPAAPPGYGGAPLGRWVGCFYVDHYGADDAGGVWFRTAFHANGIGPDMMSYGFAYRPQEESCPFGGASPCGLVWLFGDWYYFAVSDG